MAEPTWDDFPVVGQAPATMPNPQAPRGPVYGPAPTPARPPAPPSPTDQWRTLTPEEITQSGLAPDKVYQVNATGQIRAAGDSAGGNGDPKAYAAAREKLMQAIGLMNRVAIDATDNRMFPGLGETGTSGNFMRNVPGVANPAKSLAADITTLEANFAFDALQAMRDASKTGGALGNVTERELDLLKAAVSNVDPNLEHDTFLRNMDAARQAYLSKLALVDAETARKMGYDPKRAEGAWLELNEIYNERFGLQEPAPAFETVPGGEWKVERID